MTDKGYQREEIDIECRAPFSCGAIYYSLDRFEGAMVEDEGVDGSKCFDSGRDGLLP